MEIKTNLQLKLKLKDTQIFRAMCILAVNARTVSAYWLLCHHRAVRPS